jgi:hydroxyethylthiazole kinase-like uncharacterized protein yjeF
VAVLPVLTPAQMAAVDAAAPEPLDVLVERAGWAVARAAIRLLGGTYGRRVGVVAGKGNNGADGRVAARLLARAGVRCVVVTPGKSVPSGVDLVIDAAYGTGLRDAWSPPPQPSAPVLAVDIPSGVDGLTGLDLGSWRADHTVTFAALKPGLLFHPGAGRTGSWEIADIGLVVSDIDCFLVEDHDAGRWTNRREATAHKWDRAVRVVAGSPGMSGAGFLTAAAAQRAGAGMVAISSPGVLAADVERPVEAVARDLPSEGWADRVLVDLERFSALAVGPGLGDGAETMAEVARIIAASPIPVVVDADALRAVAARPGAVADASAPVVVTPHDGEFRRLAGRPIGPDRIAAARDLALRLGATVLLKGPTTVVAGPDGETRLVTAGSRRLATAGSGDVLTGVIAALLDPAASVDSTAAAAHWHGRAAALGTDGLVASDLPALLVTAGSALGSR